MLGLLIIFTGIVLVFVAILKIATGGGMAFAILAGGAAVAVHPDKKKIFLVNGAKIKYYDLSDVLERKYELHTNSGLVSGSGLMGHMDNISSSIKKSENSGLFVSAKDADHPELYTRFKSDK